MQKRHPFARMPSAYQMFYCDFLYICRNSIYIHQENSDCFFLMSKNLDKYWLFGVSKKCLFSNCADHILFSLPLRKSRLLLGTPKKARETLAFSAVRNNGIFKVLALHSFIVPLGKFRDVLSTFKKGRQLLVFSDVQKKSIFQNTALHSLIVPLGKFRPFFYDTPKNQIQSQFSALILYCIFERRRSH